MRKIFMVAALFISSQVQAQIFRQKQIKDSAIISTGDEVLYLSRTLDRVVITTNKYPKKQSQTGKVTTVIPKETLERLQGRSLGEILNTVAGVTINGANNNSGTNLRTSIRGSSDGNVLILIDGLPANDPSVISNYYDLNFIHPSQIERIEVLKGAQSTLYGSDAVSGVINIITKRTETKKAAPYASASFGSYHTFNTNAGIRGQTKAIIYNAYVGNVSSQGFSSAYDSTANKGFDKDGFDQYILRGELGLKLTNDLQWNFSGNYSSYKAAIDAAAYTDDKDFITKNKNWQLTSGMHLRHRNGALHLNYQFNYMNRFYFDDSVDRASFAYYSNSTYIGRTHYAEAYDTYRWSRVSLLAGVDFRSFNTNQVYNSISMFGPFTTELTDDLARMKQTSGYLSLVYNNGNANIELGGRLNSHNIYGENFTYTFNPSYLVQQKVKLFANVSSAFKTPTLFQLFDVFSGNQNLDPEKSTIVEGGAEVYPTGNMRIRLTGFYRKTKNAIQYIIVNPQTFRGYYFNTNNQRNSGIELEFNYEGEKWSVASNYTFTKGKVSSGYSEDGTQLSKDTTYNNLYRVPGHVFNSSFTYAINKKISISSLLRYVGERMEPVYASVPKKLDDYFTIDIAAQYRFNQNLRAFIDLKNITNQRFFDVLGYNSRRFNFTAGINLGL